MSETLPPEFERRIEALNAKGLSLEADFLLYLWRKEALEESYLSLPDEELSRLAEEERRYLARCQSIVRQIGTSAKKVRGIAGKTRRLRESILAASEELDKPVTVRQMFYFTG